MLLRPIFKILNSSVYPLSSLYYNKFDEIKINLNLNKIKIKDTVFHFSHFNLVILKWNRLMLRLQSF